MNAHVSEHGGSLPPVAPQVVAAAVEGLTSRLRKKLDAAVEQYTALPVEADGEVVRIRCGEDAVVTLSPGGSGAVLEDDQAQCTCLLAPRCLHRAAVLSACPVADANYATAETQDTSSAAEVIDGAPAEVALGTAPGLTAPGEGGQPSNGQVAAGGQPSAADGRMAAADGQSADAGGQASAGGGKEPVPVAAGPTAAQVAAAASLWRAGVAVLAAGVSAAGAVPQAELLRAAHTARLAGLPRAEAAAVRVVRGLRSARAPHGGHRLADLVSALRELLLIAGRLAASDSDPALVGTVRRNYEQGGSLRVYGVFREPVISATGYGGVVTHVVTEDGRWFSVSDVRPGGAARARGAGTATVAIGSAMLSHAQLARAGLLIAGATVSPDGRLGAGSGVRATAVKGMPWTEGPMATLFARPLEEAARTRLSGHAWSEADTADEARLPIGCDLMIIGAAGDHILARALTPTDLPNTAAAGGVPTGGDASGRVPSSAGLSSADVQGDVLPGSTASGTAPSEAGASGGEPWGAAPSESGASGRKPSGVGPSGKDAGGVGPSGPDVSGVGPSGDAGGVGPSGPDVSGGDLPDGGRVGAEPPGGEAARGEASGGGLAGTEMLLGASGPVIRLVPASRHPDLAHVANLQRLASRPGVCVRVVGRVEPDRAATLVPMAVGPVPGAEQTLRLPDEWQGRADLGYDRLQTAHLPPADPVAQAMPVGEVVDPVGSAPLWRVRRLVELAVAGGRRAVAESGRSRDFGTQESSLRKAGFRSAAELAKTLTSEADRRERDVFGRLTDAGPDRYAWAWLAAATHLVATERALIQSSWQSPS